MRVSQPLRALCFSLSHYRINRLFLRCSQQSGSSRNTPGLHHDLSTNVTSLVLFPVPPLASCYRTPVRWSWRPRSRSRRLRRRPHSHCHRHRHRRLRGLCRPLARAYLRRSRPRSRPRQLQLGPGKGLLLRDQWSKCTSTGPPVPPPLSLCQVLHS